MCNTGNIVNIYNNFMGSVTIKMSNYYVEQPKTDIIFKSVVYINKTKKNK